MMSQLEGSMFASDPALPCRDVLLDPSAMADRFAASAPAVDGEIGQCRLRRAKYRIGESLRVVYDVDVDGVTHTLAGRMSSAGTFRQPVAVPAGSSPFGGVFHHADLNTVWWAFPNDRKLRRLDALFAPAPTLAGWTGTGWTRSELVEYAPEHCATVRCLDGDDQVVAYAKAYRDGVGRHLPARYRRIAKQAAAGNVTRTPRPLAWSDELDVLVLEALPGRRWADLAPDELPAMFGLLGPAVAAVHRMSPGWTRRFGRLLPERVVHSAELVAIARPDLAALCAALAEQLRHGPPAADSEVLLHGDVHPGNALLDGDQVSLIDLDQSGVGSPAADIGSLAARLRYGDIVGGGAGRPGAELFAAFAAGYASLRPLPSPAVLRWHTAAALVAERAMRAVNRVHRDALSRLDEVLTDALHLLEGGYDDVG
jgi:aminoglycoside phosphotransferase